MRDVLRYEGFIGSVHFDSDAEYFYGKIEGIDDLVTFEGRSVRELKQAFQDAVADYRGLCMVTGKPLHKSYKGSFNVRITPELHRRAAQRSLMLGISLNRFVQNAIEKEIKGG